MLNVIHDISTSTLPSSTGHENGENPGGGGRPAAEGTNSIGTPGSGEHTERDVSPSMLTSSANDKRRWLSRLSWAAPPENSPQAPDQEAPPMPEWRSSGE